MDNECLADAGALLVTAASNASKIVGDTAPLTFTPDADGLDVPGQAVHEFGIALRIAGTGLVEVH